MGRKRRSKRYHGKGIQTEDTPRAGRNTIWKPAIIAVLLTVPYWITIGHEYTLDDTRVIEVNRFVQGGVGQIPHILARQHWYAERGYRPLPTISFAVEKTLFDSSPFVAHCFNIILYAATLLLLFVLLKRLFPQEIETTLWIAVGLFAVHPVHTEVISSVKSRDEILCLLFFTSSLITLFRNPANPGSSFRRYFSSVALFLLAAMSKETAVVFPLLYVAVFFFVRRKTIPGSFLPSLPFFAVGLLYCFFLRYAVGLTAGASEESVLNNALAAAPSLWSRTATAVLIMGKYLRLLVFPYPLVHDYSYDQIPLVTSVAHPGFWIASAVVSSLLFCAALSGRRRGRPALAICFLFVPLLPVSNILFLIGSTMGERFLYTPSLAVSLALLSLPDRIRNRLSTAPILYALGLAGFFVATYTGFRADQWKDNSTLYSRDLRHSSRNASMHASLANQQITLAERGQYSKRARDSLYREAIGNLKKSLEIYEPNYYAHGNLGQAYAYFEMLDSAFAHLRRAEELEKNDRTTFLVLADLMFESRMYDSAYARYEEAYRTDPSNPLYVLRLGDIKALTGETELARDYYARILEAYPNYAPARKRIAVLDNVAGPHVDTTE